MFCIFTKDCYGIVQQTTLVVIERLQQILHLEVRNHFLNLFFFLKNYDKDNEGAESL